MNDVKYKTIERKNEFLTPSQIDSEISRYDSDQIKVKQNPSIPWHNSVHALSSTVKELGQHLHASSNNPEYVGGSASKILPLIENLWYQVERFNLLGEKINKIYAAEEVSAKLKDSLIEKLLLNEASDS